MILWHDSLGSHANLTLLARNYPVLTGFPSTRQTHKLPGLYSISGVNFTLQTPILQDYTNPSLDGREVCIIGFRFLAASTVSTNTTLLSVRTALGTDSQIRVKFRQKAASSSTYFLEIERGVGEEIFYQTKEYPINQWMFFELRVVFAQSGGKITWRVNNQIEAVVSNIKTEKTGIDRRWDAILFEPAFASGSVRFADFYACNGNIDKGKRYATFLGDSVGVVMWPNLKRNKGSRFDWAHTYDKYRLVVLAGQSNMEGVGPAASWPTANTYIQIWDRVSGSPAFRNLQAGVNNNSHLAEPIAVQPWFGPEMKFAQRLADFYIRGDQSPPTPLKVRFIKGSPGGSQLGPNLPNFTWDHLTPGNLWNNLNGVSSRGTSLLLDIVNAVAAIGGWHLIERLDFFWNQGEADSVLQSNALAYQNRLAAFFAKVRTDIPLAVEKLRFHVFQLNKNAGGSVQSFRDIIIQAQKNAPLIDPNSVTLNVDHAVMFPDYIHYTGPGYDTLGDVAFESWWNAQEFSSYIDDLRSPAYTIIDDEWVGSDLAGAEALYQFDDPKHVNNRPVLCVNNLIEARMRQGTRNVSLLVDRGVSHSIPISSATYTRHRQNVLVDPNTMKPWLPERLKSEMGLRTETSPPSSPPL